MPVLHYHFVVRLGTWTHRLKESVADLHTLDGLHTHNGAGQGRVQTSV